MLFSVLLKLWLIALDIYVRWAKDLTARLDGEDFLSGC